MRHRIHHRVRGRHGVQLDELDAVQPLRFARPSARVNDAHLRAEGLSETFVEYMKSWKGFVLDNEGTIDDELILNS